MREEPEAGDATPVEARSTSQGNNIESPVLHCSCTGKRGSQVAVGSRAKETATTVGRELPQVNGYLPERHLETKEEIRK